MSKSIQVYVDSTYRYGGRTSNFPYNLQVPITNAKSFKLTTAEIPLSYYNIRNTGLIDDNHLLHFSENNGATTLTASLASGYYTTTSIVSPLQTAMNSASANAYTYTVAYNSTTSKITITSTGNFKLMYPTWLSVNWVLGFNQVSSSNTTSQVAQTFPYFDYYAYFYLRFNINSALRYDETGSQNNIIKVPINNPQGSVQYYFDNSDNKFEILDNRPLQSFTTELLDSDYYPIDLLGREISFTLTFYYD
jgi:hypothetical protein